MSEQTTSKLNIATTIVFCALIGGLTVASMLNPVREKSETENRSLAQMPKLSAESLFKGDFARDYETFITDQFVARDAWISLKTKAEIALGKRDSGGVYFAANGYYIEKFEPDSSQIEINIDFLTQFVTDISGDYSVRTMIVPTSSLILADKLPMNAPVWDQSAMLDRLAQVGGFVDTREILSAHSDEYIYYRTDHHWTTEGAYYAYASLADSLGFEPIARDQLNAVTLSEDFLGTTIAKVGITSKPDTIITLESASQPTVSLDYNLGTSKSDSIYVRDKLATRDKYAVFLGGNDPVVEITTSVANGKTLLLVKDSYANCMVALLANHYERIILVDLRYFNMGVETFLEWLKPNKGVTVDDVVVLYNATSFANDRYLLKIKN